MNKYINLTIENIDDEHICCAIGDSKHREGVDSKKEWIKNKLKDGHVFRKLDAKGEFISNTILNANSFEKLIK